MTKITAETVSQYSKSPYSSFLRKYQACFSELHVYYRRVAAMLC